LIVEILEFLFLVVTALIITYVVRHYLFTITILRNQHRKLEKPAADDNAHYEPSVSILIPARNEEQVIGRLLHRITELTYPKEKMQVIVINDGSSDNTGRIADEYAKMHNYFTIVHRKGETAGRGKASALNAGLNLAEGEIIICFDADYYPQEDILEKLTREFSDPRVGAVQGRVTVLNEPLNMVTRLVALERIGGYLIDQQARDSLGLIPQFGGTVGGLRRSLLERMGGWDESVLAEDMDLTFRVYLAGYKVRYINEAECYEEAVESWRDYRKQRYRWAKGHMQCFFKHWFQVIKSKNLNIREKIDGLLLLNIYFMPVWVLLSWIVGVPLIFSKSFQWLSLPWTVAPIAFYSSVGNFAPFFEVGIGAYLDGRSRAHRLLPLLIFTFLYNIFICTKALTSVLVCKLTGNNNNHWSKTNHTGNGNRYITNCVNSLTHGNCSDSGLESNSVCHAAVRSCVVHVHHAFACVS